MRRARPGLYIFLSVFRLFGSTAVVTVVCCSCFVLCCHIGIESGRPGRVDYFPMRSVGGGRGGRGAGTGTGRGRLITGSVVAKSRVGGAGTKSTPAPSSKPVPVRQTRFRREIYFRSVFTRVVPFTSSRDTDTHRSATSDRSISSVRSVSHVATAATRTSPDHADRC